MEPNYRGTVNQCWNCTHHHVCLAAQAFSSRSLILLSLILVFISSLPLHPTPPPHTIRFFSSAYTELVPCRLPPFPTLYLSTFSSKPIHLAIFVIHIERGMTMEKVGTWQGSQMSLPLVPGLSQHLSTGIAHSRELSVVETVKI